MLRASVEASGGHLDARAITNPSIDPGIAGGRALVAFVDAFSARQELDLRRNEVQSALGPAGLVDAAGVIANFEMMNRVAEGTGIPVGKGSLARTESWRAALGLDVFRHQ